MGRGRGMSDWKERGGNGGKGTCEMKKEGRRKEEGKETRGKEDREREKKKKVGWERRAGDDGGRGE